MVCNSIRIRRVVWWEDPQGGIHVEDPGDPGIR